MSSSFKLKLLRADTAVDSIPVLTEDNYLNPPVVSRKPQADCTNDVKVQYSQRVGLEIAEIVGIAKGDWGNWVLMSDGRVWTWGLWYMAGQCDDLNSDDSEVPVLVNTTDLTWRITNSDWYPYGQGVGYIKIVDIQSGSAAGDIVFCLDSNGQVWALGSCDGWASRCRCGDSGYPPDNDYQGSIDCLMAVAGSYYNEHSFSFAKPGAHNSVAIDTSGKLWAWGDTIYGIVGNGTCHEGGVPEVCIDHRISGDMCVPFNIVNSNQDGSGDISTMTWIDCVSAYEVAAAVNSSGELYTWGTNVYGELGHGVDYGDNSPYSDYWPYPTKVGTDTDWVRVFAGEGCLAAMKSDGTVWFCGWDIAGAFGMGSYDNYYSTFTKGANDMSFEEFRFAFYWSMGRSGDKTYTWGMDVGSGNLGQGDTNDYFSPTELPVHLELFDIAQYAGIGVDYSGNVWHWGYDVLGETLSPIMFDNDWIS